MTNRSDKRREWKESWSLYKYDDSKSRKGRRKEWKDTWEKYKKYEEDDIAIGDDTTAEGE